MKTADVCFLWHMHQPYYTDPVTGSASMPWVRLHAIKAYFDMAHMFERFPSIKATVNFTPSLLLQLRELGEDSVRDLFLEHARRPAEELRPEERAFLIRHYFSANWATMVRPFSRYHELLVKRGLHVPDSDLEQVSKQFTTQDFLDLQVWFNLAWFGFGAVRRYPRLAALREKNRGFTEEDKREVLSLQRSVVRDVVPFYRALAERRQIELTTSPFFHPILPLVIDTETTRRARPDLPLPGRFRAPEDAESQLRLAVDYHREAFGMAPVGLWPSEGSVCPELIPILPRVGLQWLATDEGILARSFHAAERSWHRPADLYRAYRTGPGGNEVSIIFRDREISDAFGFVYHRTSPDSAADDVVRRLHRIIEEAPQDHVLISIILDGENPWEHYHEGGEPFLTRLYEALAQGSINDAGRRIVTATVSEALPHAPAADPLTHLHSGSWINQDFKIWIGHEEDNRGWDMLGHTRSRLLEISPTLPPEKADAAWRELYAAEGSDWFWWYGDDFDTAYKQEFDRMFRTHLKNVWALAGLSPPEVLNQPICGARAASGEDGVVQPVSFIHPALDGLITDFFEWRGAGTINPNPPLGAMWQPGIWFTALCFGWDEDHLFLRLDPDERSETKQADVQIEVLITTAASVFRLSWPLLSKGTRPYQLWRQAAEGKWESMGDSRLIKRQAVIELAVPFKELSVQAGDRLALTVMVMERGLEVARYPHHRPAGLTVPGPDFEAGMWRV